MLPYVSLCDLYDLDIFPYTADTPTLSPLTLLTTIKDLDNVDRERVSSQNEMEL